MDKFFRFDTYYLKNGEGLFMEGAITKWDSSLKSLTDGTDMFYNCDSLVSFNSDMDKLEIGKQMFFIVAHLHHLMEI